MKRKFDARPWLILILIVVLILLGWYAGQAFSPKQAVEATATEQPVVTIPLTGPLADRNAEVSGLAWYGDTLILMPQYPNFSSEYKGDGFLYALPKADIVAFLDGKNSAPLSPRAIPLNDAALAETVKDYQGFEAIVFSGDRIFLTIEAGEGTNMSGYLISGKIESDLSAVTLDIDSMVEIPLQDQQDNKSDESILIVGDSLLTFYEVNGAGLVPVHVANVFDFDLNFVETVSFPTIEYRVTDAASSADGTAFWVINYFFPGDEDLKPASDPLAETFGLGPTHSQSETVERLVEMRYSEEGIALADTPPVLLTLIPDTSRNWEGLVLLHGRGFLMATDKFPETILAFVAMP
ncbi:MAG: hypothetical protein ACOYZ6_11480 [Chloroflexota bacterium]